jgi:hypothetical protein
MGFAFNLDQMTVADKLAAMERLWEDLGRTPEVLPSPSWHGDFLKAVVQGLVDVEEGRTVSLVDVKKRFGLNC